MRRALPLVCLLALLFSSSACAPRAGSRPAAVTQESFVIADQNNTVVMRRYRITVPASHGWVATVQRGPRTDQVDLIARGDAQSAFMISAAWLPLSPQGAAKAPERTPEQMADLFFDEVARPMITGQGGRDFSRAQETVGSRRFDVLRWTTPGPAGETKQSAAYAYAPLPRDNDGVYVFTYGEIRRLGADPSLSRKADFDAILTSLDTPSSETTAGGR